MGADFSVTIEDHSKEVIGATNAELAVAMEAIGLQATGYAQAGCPVDTGLLRNSITYAVSGKPTAIRSYKSDNTSRRTGKPANKSGKYDGKAPDDKSISVYIGTNVSYAPFVEEGANGQPARHFIKPSVENHVSEFQGIIEAQLAKLSQKP